MYTTDVTWLRQSESLPPTVTMVKGCHWKSQMGLTYDSFLGMQLLSGVISVLCGLLKVLCRVLKEASGVMIVLSVLSLLNFL